MLTTHSLSTNLEERCIVLVIADGGRVGSSVEWRIISVSLGALDKDTLGWLFVHICLSPPSSVRDDL